MLGSFLTRGLVMALGYVYPAYECYKTVERNKPEIEQLRFWCQYWILIACLTVFERIGDAFVSWVPMYSEAKLAFIIYLWYPKTMGTTYVYDSFFRPYVAKHENEIDRNLLELRTRAGDVAVIYWQRAFSYGQTRIFDILQYVAAQSTPRPQPAQQQRRAGARQPPSTSKSQASSKPLPSAEEPPSPTSSTSSSQGEDDNVTDNGGPSDNKTTINKAISKTQNARVVQSAQIIQSAQSNHSLDAEPEKSKESTPPTEAEPMQIEIAAPAEPMQIEIAAPPEVEKANGPPIETVMEETIRVTRGRLRKTRSAGTK